MSNYIKFFFFSLILFSITSCGTSNNVSSNHLIQKRKYTKGYRLNKSSSFKKEQKKEVLSENTSLDSKINKSNVQENVQASESDQKHVSNKREKTTEKGDKIPKTKAQKLLDFKEKLKDFYAFKPNESHKEKIKEHDLEKKSEVNQPVSKQENSEVEEEGQKYSISAIIGFILAILAVLCIITLFLGVFSILGLSSWVIVTLLSIFTFLFGIGSVVFSIVGLKKTSRGELKGKPFALTGLIMGGSTLIISVLALFLFLILVLIF